MFGSMSTIFLSSWSSLDPVASERQRSELHLSKSTRAASNRAQTPFSGGRGCRRLMSMELKSMSNVPQPETFDPLAIVRSDHVCFGCGDDNPIGLHLRFAADGDGVR